MVRVQATKPLLNVYMRFLSFSHSNSGILVSSMFIVNGGTDGTDLKEVISA